MQPKEVRIAVTAEATPKPITRYFMVNEDRARNVLREFEHYRESGVPDMCRIDYQDAGDDDHMMGRSGMATLACAYIADMHIA